MRKIDHFHQLMMKNPGVEPQPERRQLGKSKSKLRVERQPCRVGLAEHANAFLIPPQLMSDAAEAAMAGGKMSFKNRFDALSQPEVGITDKTGRNARVEARQFAHHEFRFSNWAKLLGAILSMTTAEFDTDSADYTVAAKVGY
jgi:hypothetical protein